VLEERLAVAGRPHGHADRLGVVLLLEEDLEVFFGYVTEQAAHQQAFEGQPPLWAVPRRMRPR
jgi:hypothetical protein